MHPPSFRLALAVSLSLATVAVAHADPLPEGAVARLGTTRFRGDGHFFGAALSPDGKVLATVSYAGIRLHDPASGKEVRRIPHDGGDFFRQDSLTLSRDGKLL